MAGRHRPDLNVNCNGGATFYGRRFGCWVVSGHGAVDLTKAIYQSCDVFFYTLAEKLGIDRIAKYATSMGLGQKTGIDLPEEASGVMPSEEWKIRNFKQKWYAGETISVGIGQGAVATTPVQLMRAIAAIPWTAAWSCPMSSARPDCPPQYLETHHYMDVKNIPIDPSGFGVDYRRDGPCANAGGHGAFGACAGHRYRRENRQPASAVSLKARAPHANNSPQSERMVCGIRSPGAIRRLWCGPVRRRTSTANWRHAWRPKSSRPMWTNSAGNPPRWRIAPAKWM